MYRFRFHIVIHSTAQLALWYPLLNVVIIGSLGSTPAGGDIFMPGISNGKSSIVEERLYSFFFAFFHKKTKLRFFVFPLLHNQERRRSLCFDLVKFLLGSLLSASFSQIFGTTLFVLDFGKVGLIPFASLCSSKILEQPGRFCIDLQKFRNKQFVLLSILLYFGLNSFSLRS